MSSDPLQQYSVKETALLLDLSESFVFEQAKAGHWPCRVYGPRLIKFTREDITEIQDAAKRGPKVHLAEVVPLHGTSRVA